MRVTDSQIAQDLPVIRIPSGRYGDYKISDVEDFRALSSLIESLYKFMVFAVACMSGSSSTALENSEFSKEKDKKHTLRIIRAKLSIQEEERKEDEIQEEKAIDAHYQEKKIYCKAISNADLILENRHSLIQA